MHDDVVAMVEEGLRGRPSESVGGAGDENARHYSSFSCLRLSMLQKPGSTPLWAPAPVSAWDIAENTHRCPAGSPQPGICLRNGTSAANCLSWLPQRKYASPLRGPQCVRLRR